MQSFKGEEVCRRRDESEDAFTERILNMGQPLAATGNGPLWLFRGAASSAWELTSSIERHHARTNCQCTLSAFEWHLVREFQRAAHQYLDRIPAYHSILEWLSVMRHFGAPTRLLDWTYSFYVALFFAYEQVKVTDLWETPPSDSNDGKPKFVSVWAVNSSWLEEKFREMPSEVVTSHLADPQFEDRGTFGKVFGGRRNRFVLQISAFEKNERVIAQQGTFLCAGNVDVPFHQTLMGMLPTRSHEQALRRFDFPVVAAPNVLRRLRAMNLTRATIYPGLQGFAESLQNMGHFPELLTGPFSGRQYRLGIHETTRSRRHRR